ncbi:MAG: tyrosine-protein phosphatase [Lachnospiraceae bacterium]|nr:tyrosine-protein phosphatase [Lachnospiraceae bacterium]
MASSVIHLAITNELTKRRTFKDPARLRLGSVLPDAGTSGKSHLKKKVWGCNKNTYDFERFRELFGERMRADDLYLGYYLHLVQDLVYRHFVYDKYHWNPNIEGNVQLLHRDYEIGNTYVIRKYQLVNDLVIPADFRAEPLTQVCEPDPVSFMHTMDSYFKDVVDGEIFFFTKEMADEYIGEALEVCLQELEELDKEETGIPLDGYEHAWDKTPRSILESTLNTRELGTYRVDATGTYTLKNRILRSDCPLQISEKDTAVLQKKEITTIIDLREEEAVLKKPHALAKKEGFTYVNCPVTEGSGIPESVEAVPGSYLAIARSEGVLQAFHTIAQAPAGVMINCSAGKDRTGVVSALLLSLCGVRRSDVVYDYMRTGVYNEERFKKIHEMLPEVDMNIVIPHETYMETFLDLLLENYGSVEGYFTAIGIDGELQRKLREKLCGADA